MKPLPCLAAGWLLTCGLFAAEPTTFSVPEPIRAPASSPAAPTARGTTSESIDSQEVASLYRESQDDRLAGGTINWSQVIPRDAARLKRVKRIYAAGELRTGTDYYYAAMILQYGDTPEDFLLAHELCIVAIIKGDSRAKWLAAATEDRFLIKMGRPQRFGTQRTSSSAAADLGPAASDVTDVLRREFNVAPLPVTKNDRQPINAARPSSP